MMARIYRVLMVEDSADDADLIQHELKKKGLVAEIKRVETEAQMISALQLENWDVVLCDFSLPKFNAPGAISVLKKQGLDLPLIIVSGTVGEESAVEAMRAGAQDFVLKGNIIRLVPAILREIHEAGRRKRGREAEEGLQKSEVELQHLQKLDGIGRLASGIAHDFNNLLAAISLNCEVLLDEAGENLELRSGIEDIRHVTERGASLTRQLLLFSKRQVATPELVGINETIDGVSKMLKRLVGDSISMKLDLEQESGRVRADPGQLEQIVMNLVVNARDAISKTGEIRIATFTQTVTEPISSFGLEILSGQYAVLSVEDNGCGMELEVQNRVFESFFTTKPMGKGIGLGLSTTYSIVKSSGGTIQLESAPGKGTTFRVYFPLAEKFPDIEEAVKLEKSHSESFAGRVILVVEDDERLLRLIEKHLKSRGYQVIGAQSPHAGLREFQSRQSRVDLVLTDVHMPELSGIDFAQELRRISTEVPVLFMSGGAPEGLAVDALTFIQKPFSGKDLLEKISLLLASRDSAGIEAD